MGSSVLDGRADTGFSAGRDADALATTFFPVYERLFDEDDEFVRSTEQTLAEARMPQTVELYLSRALGFGVIAGLLLWLLGLAVGYLLFVTGAVEIGTLLGVPIGNEALLSVVETLRVPFLVFVTGLVFGSVGFALGFGTLVGIPYSRAAARRREINLLLADSVSFMYALSVGGLNQLEIIEAMAAADDTYGEVAREFQSIVNETEYFDDDYRTAIRKQVDLTPSTELAEFLTDMLAIINSGGEMEQFLEDKKHKHLRTSKQQQERILDTLELFGEMYITLSLFPLLLIIVLIVMSMLGEASTMLLLLTVYGLIPLLGVGFVVLVSTVKQDDPGDGRIREAADKEWSRSADQGGLLDLGIVEAFTDRFQVFRKIRRGEARHALVTFLKQPHHHFRDNPHHTLGLTVPLAALWLLWALLSGMAPTSFDGMVANPVWGTFALAYLPMFVTGVPLAVFYEWNRRSRHAVLTNLSETLRKLAGVNDTGMTLLESLGAVAETSTGKLAQEFRTIHLQVTYGMNVTDAFVDFNNRYRVPRLARTVRLITKAQSASNEMRAVLSTAATASENQDDIERERRSRTRMQIAVILMTFLTLLGVMAILKTQFLGSMGDLSTQSQGAEAVSSQAQAFGSGVDTNLVSLLFFHAVTIQAVLSGFISGYIRDARLLSGVKYVVALLAVALAVWAVVG